MLSRLQKSWNRSKSIPVLPARVLLLIIEYATGVRRHSRPTGAASLGHLQSQLLPFMAICRHWRSIISPLYYYEAFISVPVPETASRVSAAPAQDMLQIVRFGFDRVVKRLVILLSHDVFSDPEALTTLGLRLPPNRLSNITETIVDFSGLHWDSTFTTKTYGRSIHDICDIFNYAMPNVKYLAFTSHGHVYTGVDSGCLELVNRLTKGKKSLTMSIPLKVSTNQPFAAPISLTHIAISRTTLWSHVIVGTIRANSQTLAGLQLDNINLTYFKRLLETSKGAHIVYRHLRRLEISLNASADEQRPVLKHLAFPAITHIYNKQHHPFADDSILRCNPRELQVLKIPIDAPLFEMLVKRDAFTGNKYPCLQMVDISFSLEQHQLRSNVTLSHVYDRINDLSAGVSSLRCRMGSINPLSAISLTRSSSSIRYLSLPWLHLDLELFIRLGWRLPNLCTIDFSLDCVFDGVSDTEPRDKDIKRIQRTASVSNRLLAIGIHFESQADQRRISEYTILLASLIPTLAEVLLWPPKRYNVLALHDCLTRARKRSVYKDIPHMKFLKVHIKNPSSSI